MNAGENLVRVEKNRGRVSLGRAVPGLKPGDLFRINERPDGSIVLTPVKTVPIKPSKTKMARYRDEFGEDEL